MTGAAGVESLHPNDASLNLPEETYSLEVRRRIAEGKGVVARVMASLEKITAEVFADALHRDPERSRARVAVVDGDKKQLRLLKQQARKHQLDLTIVLDLIHVAEYLWKAGAVFHPSGTPQLEACVQISCYVELDITGDLESTSYPLRCAEARRRVCSNDRAQAGGAGVVTCGEAALSQHRLWSDLVAAQASPGAVHLDLR